jgi:uncharacterized protein (TIGR03435 family)
VDDGEFDLRGASAPQQARSARLDRPGGLSYMGYTAILLLLLTAGLAAQDSEFEAASVKAHQPGPKGSTFSYWGCSGGPGWTDPIRYNCTNVTLLHLIQAAWGLKDYQLIGPDSLDGLTFDVTAKIPVGATADQFKQMLQKLLTDRFHLVVHHETRKQQVYVLTVNKDGHKLQVPPPGDTETFRDALDNNPNGDGKADAARSAQLRAMMEQAEPNRPTRTDLAPARIGFRMNNGVTKLAGRRATVTDLTHAVAAQLGVAILDHTDLAGEWNFTIEYGSTSPPAASSLRAAAAPANEPAAPSGGPSIFTAFEKQLGLDLKSSKEPADVLVVDKFDKIPVAN